MTFDEVLEDVGGFGLFQVLVLALLYPPRMLLPCNFLLNNFIAAVPPHHCDVGAALWNLTLEQRLRAGVPVGPDGSPASCVMFTEPRLQPPSDGSNGTEPPTVPCQSGFVYDNSTFASTVATEWDLVCDRKSLTKTCSTIFFMGVMTGAAAFGYFSDKYEDGH
ncbi:solute carrier family 22 member 7-like [Betta splendens]|uniref:Solute carrier family 22 member 7-like n=1 Tax=Betta splendens TaxID=158456 RepID=A0A9W2XAN2_BETSP|nr:solute carrier family 22 member 7-like [Betta splendens]